MLTSSFIFEPKRKKSINTNLTFLRIATCSKWWGKKIPNQLIKAVIGNGNVLKILV